MSRSTALAAAVALVAQACSCGGGEPPPPPCSSSSDCSGDRICVDGRCVDVSDVDAGPGGPDGGGRDGAVDAAACAAPCGAACCAAGELCVEDAACVGEATACGGADDCSDDRYCHPELGACVPFGVPEGHDVDPECSRIIVAGTFAPTVQCEFREAPEGDPFPAHVHVLGTPMVADFGIGRGPDAPPSPSIVAVFDDGVDGSSELPTGVIRVLDGATCAQTAELGSLELACHSCPPAIGDLDGDGRPEIVANKANGGVVAFAWDAATAAWVVRWRSTTADGVTPYEVTGAGWAGPSIYDLDDDGTPEVVRGGVVLDADGRLLDDSLGVFDVETGLFGVVADVDGDGRAEQVQGHGVWEWDPAAPGWVAEAWSPGGAAPGHVAIADFGAYPGARGWPPDAPEVVVVEGGRVRVQTLDGELVFGPIAIPAGGVGGPPTVADFDGDGRPEIATAGATRYVVVDLDCSATPIGACASGTVDGVLWTRASQDASSNRTGSSVFDFEGDGRAEAVYGDECFLRVYDGERGDVIFSQYRSSCTWYENPVIADVDGDFNAEIVIGNNFNCGDAALGIACGGLEPGNVDPLFAGLRCAEGADCLSGTCDAGLCRCVADAECCAGAGCDLAGFVCAPPPAGTPGAGDTCRASRPFGALGIRVYRDARDRWVRSRRIWNQHAYHVTNVDEDGRVPSTTAAALNWRTDGLNNFRQNIQGSAAPGASPDLTSRGDAFSCRGGILTLTANVCNRGTEPVGAGLVVGFYEGDPDAGGTALCRVPTTSVLEPGDCARVECPWAGAPDAPPGATVTIVADDAGADGECYEGNNRSVVSGVVCDELG